MTDPQRLQVVSPLPEHPPGAIVHCDFELVGVLVTHDWRRLIALSPIAAGTRILTLEGRVYARPTRHSVQVGPDLHIDAANRRNGSDTLRRYPYRFMDHACDPTAIIRGRHVIARRDIAAGEAVTFNYNTTELELSEPFRCRCESAMCVGLVRGAKHLTASQRALIANWMADYLR